LNGRPLIAYTIDAAKSFAEKFPGDITISTDDAKIKAVASEYGVSSGYERPAALATDNAGKLEVISDILDFEERNRKKKYEYILDLDATSPLRNLDDLSAAFELLKTDGSAINLFSVNPANRNPYFNMVEQQEDGYYGLSKKGSFLTRQSAPRVFELNASFYFYKRDFFNRRPQVINDRSLIYVMPHICFDLDHPLDFEFMAFLLANDKLDFNL
jgi:CMP-N-acetylneuraminic acid synthetase